MSSIDQSGGILTIDLDAIVENWRDLNRLVSCAAVVKADAYGLGAHRVAPALARAGCQRFFVASFDEGAALRSLLPDPEILVLNGPFPGGEAGFAAHRLTPVLNSPGQVAAWGAFAQGKLSSAIHLDSAMNRLGLAEREFLEIDEAALKSARPLYVMSHLACAEEKENPLNARQLALFQELRKRLPEAKASLANSSGIFLGKDYGLDFARPGAALYGVNPTLEKTNPMRQVARLEGRIIQLRRVDSEGSVGYGATHAARPGQLLATVGVGYADGYLRALSGKGFGYLGDWRVKLAGRVSMDLTSFDVSGAPEALARPGSFIELLGERVTVDALAEAAGTIGYEILTALGRRYHRVYVGGEASC
jgi:alanine racemase